MKDKPNINDVKIAIPEAQEITEIGSGGFKVVYKAQIANKSEAIKVVQIFTDGTDEGIREENIRRIFREIGILQQCSSPFLVKLGSVPAKEYKLGLYDYIVYSEEFIAGESVRHLIELNQQPSIADLGQLALCLLLAVQELAGMNVIHRDIKPDNIMRTENPKRKYVLLDLGIAYVVGGTQITRDTIRIPGTLYYIAPEMLEQGFRQNIDYRSDFYAIALTLYEFATGTNPFARYPEQQFTTLYRIKTEKPKPLHQLREDLPPDFCHSIDQLLKKLPALRPANFGSLISQMEGLL